MNTSCKWWRDDDDGGTACGQPTKNGRTHCHFHRVEELKRLSQAKVRARVAYEAAEKAHADYFHEGDQP